MSTYNCIDVSEHNGLIDWSAARADGVSFAFIRAGFGQDYESQDDVYFHINMENAIKTGVKVGVYFYSYATTAEQAIGEAEHCCRLIEPYKNKISFPVFYDVEENKIEHHIEETIPTFINYLNDKGYNAGVYCTVSWFDDYFKPIDCSYFWLASWGSDDGEPHTKPQWCDIWQYTSRGNVDGIKGYTDLDILYNEDMQLLRESKPNKQSVSITIRKPQSIEVLINIEDEES